MPKLGGSGADALAVHASGGTGAASGKQVKSLLGDIVAAQFGQFAPEKIAELPAVRSRKTVLPPQPPKPPRKKKEKAAGGAAGPEAPEGASAGASSAQASPERQPGDAIVIDLEEGEASAVTGPAGDVGQPSPSPTSPAKRSAEEAELEAPGDHAETLQEDSTTSEAVEPKKAIPPSSSKKGKGKQRAPAGPSPAKKAKTEVPAAPEEPTPDEPMDTTEPTVLDGTPTENAQPQPDEGPLDPSLLLPTSDLPFDRPPLPYTDNPMSSATAQLVSRLLPTPSSIPYGHQDAATLHTLALDLKRIGPRAVLSQEKHYLRLLFALRNAADRIARSLRRAREGFLGAYVDELVMGPDGKATLFDDAEAVAAVFDGKRKEEGGFRAWEDENDLCVDLRAALAAIEEMAAGAGSDEDGEEKEGWGEEIGAGAGGSS
ncbi:hypothetical protein DFJ74DRAFT_763790 [Hyaloraphidium curvatum]|nr:hypothetical protein DFJ74DRAFT_763790 [Hyaloraphidium curvatum]